MRGINIEMYIINVGSAQTTYIYRCTVHFRLRDFYPYQGWATLKLCVGALANERTLKMSSCCLEEDTVNTGNGMFAGLVGEGGGKYLQIFANEWEIVSYSTSL